MIFSSRAEYGVRLMIELGASSRNTPQPKAIAIAEGLPLAFSSRWWPGFASRGS